MTNLLKSRQVFFVWRVQCFKKYRKHQQNVFFENVIAAECTPRIGLLTRLADHSATLLDNILRNRIDTNVPEIYYKEASTYNAKNMLLSL